MNQYRVTFKRIEEFYQSILVEASSQEEAREKAEQLSEEGAIEFDYFKELDILEEYIVEVETV